jgi:hypothetical protein
VLNFSNRFFVCQKLLDRERLVSWSIVMVDDEPRLHLWFRNANSLWTDYAIRNTWTCHSFSPRKPRRALHKCHLQSFLISHKI